MAYRVLYQCSRQGRVCLPTASGVQVPIRAFSSFDERKPPNRLIDIRNISQDSSFTWPDTRLGPLEPADGRFPLPGMVGSTHPLEGAKTPMPSAKVIFAESDVLTEELPYERHSSILEQFITVNHELAKKSESNEKTSPFDVLDCSAQECPYFLLNDFRTLFPYVSVSGASLTIITLYEKQNPVALGSDLVDADLNRINLIEQFISAATDLCDSLHSAGYWADFIDPTSGRPYLASNTDVSLYEKDHQYRELGFEITNYSGCRVVAHHQLGTRPYVGCIFTKAPLGHPLIAGLTQNVLKLHEP